MSIADKLVTIAENEQRVYEKGYEEGYEEGSALYEALVMDNLEHAVIPEGAERTARGVFYERYKTKTITLPDSFKTVYDYFCYNAIGLETINLVDSIEIIKSYAFFNCSILNISKLPSNLTEIGNRAFYKCAFVRFDKIHEKVTTIKDEAFYNCTNITTLTFEGTPASIAKNAFSGCVNLTTINVPWSEGEVANAPWGATNATIVYNYNDAKTVFYLEDTEWEFEEGMTWAEFIDSDYNTDNAFFHADVSIDADGNTIPGVGYGAQYVYGDGNNPVHSSSEISVGGYYYRA